MTDGNNHTTAYAYDNLNRLTTVTGADNAVTGYTYDNAGNVLSQTNGRGHITRYEYNNLNQPTLRADPLPLPASPGSPSQASGTSGDDEGRIERYTYYADGQLQSSRDKNGITTTYAYDVSAKP